MQGFITFFRNQEHDLGRTYRLMITKGSERVLLEVYAARPIKSSVLQEDQSYKSDKEYNLFFEDLKRAVREAGGCLAVTRNDRKGGRVIVFDVVSSAQYQSPQAAVQLHSVYPPKRVKLKGQVIELPPGSHLIVPAHGEAEQQLMSFLGNLSWLSGDMRSLVLDGLRRPSLDTRVEDLEAEVLPEKPGESGSREKGLRGAWVWVSQLAMRPAPIGPVIALPILFMLIVNAMLLGTILDVALRDESTAAQTDGGGDDDDGGGGDGGDGDGDGDGSDGDGDGDDAGPFSTTVRGFYEALRGRGDNELLKLIFGVHFMDYAEISWTEESAESALKNSAFAWGIIKLQGLKQVPLREDEGVRKVRDVKFLGHENNQSDSNWFFFGLRESLDGDLLAADQIGLDMIAALACNASLSSYQWPALPKGGSGKAVFVITEKKECRDLVVGDALAGIEELTKFVETTQIEQSRIGDQG